MGGVVHTEFYFHNLNAIKLGHQLEQRVVSNQFIRCHTTPSIACTWRKFSTVERMQRVRSITSMARTVDPFSGPISQLPVTDFQHHSARSARLHSISLDFWLGFVQYRCSH